MEFLSVAACQAWVADRADDRGAAHSLVRKASVELLSSGRLLHLSRCAVRWVLGEGDASMLLVVGEHGVWASSEHAPLELALRRAWGEAEGVDAKPGLLADRASIDDVVSCLFVGLCFGWGVRLFAESGGRRVEINHDGRLVVLAASEQDINEAPGWMDA